MDCAQEAGAEVVRSVRQGKGNVVQHMFDKVDAGVYLMVDGDDTYDARSAAALVEAVRSGDADMAIGVRLVGFDAQRSFRPFHRFGNRLISQLISRIFGVRFTDVLSGYRAFSRDFVKSVPIAAQGFEIETELTAQAVAKGFSIKEHPAPYGARPRGSYSKLDTLGDGLLILRALFLIAKDFKPLTFFGSIGILMGVASLSAGYPPIADYLREGFVHHVPLAILAAGLAILATISVGIGLILHTISRYHNETFRFWRKLAKRLEGSG